MECCRASMLPELVPGCASSVPVQYLFRTTIRHAPYLSSPAVASLRATSPAAVPDRPIQYHDAVV
eukprot:2545538-Rhodomonas_salina.1